MSCDDVAAAARIDTPMPSASCPMKRQALGRRVGVAAAHLGDVAQGAGRARRRITVARIASRSSNCPDGCSQMRSSPVSKKPAPVSAFCWRARRRCRPGARPGWREARAGDLHEDALRLLGEEAHLGDVLHAQQLAAGSPRREVPELGSRPAEQGEDIPASVAEPVVEIPVRARRSGRCGRCRRIFLARLGTPDVRGCRARVRVLPPRRRPSPRPV